MPRPEPGVDMRRREFLGVLGGATAWPLAARAQQSERVQRVGMLFGVDATDRDAQARYAVFRQALQQLGWVEGRNVRYEFRWRSGVNADLARQHAAELVAVSDVILVGGATNTEALQKATQTIPI